MRADARANRQSIVEAATRQIAVHGADVPFTLIAADAGVGIATLYRNFPSRQELVMAVLESFRDHAREILERCRPLVAQDPARGWRTFVHALAALRPGALVTAFSSELVADHHVPAELESQRTLLLGSVQELIEEAIAAGVVRADLTALGLHLGIAAITRPLPEVSESDLADQQHWLVEVFLDGLRA